MQYPDKLLQGLRAEQAEAARANNALRERSDRTREKSQIAPHLKTIIVTDEQIMEIEAFCAEVHRGLEFAMAIHGLG